MNKQNSTKINNEETINVKTGLSPIQEKAIFSLLSGSKISDVAEQLSIDRSTIYLWQEKENFQAYYNYLNKKIKFETETALIALYNDAIQSLGDSIRSENESIRLKSSIWILEYIKSINIGLIDPRVIIENKCKKSRFDIEFDTYLDLEEYNNLLQINNLT